MTDTLIRVPFETVESLIRGAQDCLRENGALVPVRLPSWAWPQVPDALTRETFRQASGVRVETITDASVIELDVAATRIAVEGLDLPVYPCAIDLLVDGVDWISQPIASLGVTVIREDEETADLETAAPVQTVRFEQLPPGRKRVDLWLPANASVALHDLRADAPLLRAPEPERRWIHYGSSISHCGEAHRPTQTWPVVAARASGVDLINLGAGGSCHLDPFVARIIRDSLADCISLKVGINIVGADTMKYRTFVPAVHGFLDTIREGHPDIPVLVVSPIFCPAGEDAQGPILFDGRRAISGVPPEGKNALTLRRTREILESIVETRRVAGDRKLFYLDGLRLFGPDDADELPDALHPSSVGYVRMGKRFASAAFGPEGAFADVAATGTP